MVLVDTSVWISHFRNGDSRLSKLLNHGRVATHPFIIGEIACGHLKNREEILNLMNDLPQAVEASHQEVLRFIDIHQLMGCGLGFIDIHLLASSRLTSIPLWTNDKKLKAAAESLKIRF